MGMILRIASSRIVGQGDIVGRSGYFSLNLSANSVMRGRLDARRTLKSLVADLRVNKNNVCQEKEPSTPGSMQSLYPIFLTNTYQKTTVNFNLLSMLQRYMINCPAKKASRSLK